MQIRSGADRVLAEHRLDPPAERDAGKRAISSIGDPVHGLSQ